MNLIDRYVNAVIERLPANMKDDVSKELRGNIEDMLPRNPTENDIKEVLTKLGNPVKLAREYNQSKGYLIGPKYFDTYVMVLKIVISVFTCVLVAITLLSEIVNATVDTNIINFFANVFAKTISSIFQGVSQAFLWVTLIFYLIEKNDNVECKLPFDQKEWTVDDLKDLPDINKGSKISRGDIIVSIILTVAFTAILYFQPTLLGWYEGSASGITLKEPLFVLERLSYYMPFILILALVQLCIFVYKFITKRWTYPLAGLTAIYDIFNLILFAIMINDRSLFNPNLFTHVATVFNTNASSITSSIWPTTVNVLLIISILVVPVDIIVNFFKCRGKKV